MTSTLLLTLVITLALTVASGAQARGKPRISPERQRVVLELDQAVAHTPLRGSGRALEAAGWKHHVHPYFMAAVFATESSLGDAACRNDRYNVAGLASCQDSWPVPRFRSWPHFFDYYARFLAARWPHATSPYSFNGYAACSDCWARKVTGWMRELFGVGSAVRYGRG